MLQNIAIVSRDASQPVLTLDAAKKHLDVTFVDDDTLIQSHVDAGVSWIENYTNRFLQPVVLDLYADNLPNTPFLLPYGPVTGVTSVTVDGVAVSGIRTVPGGQYAVLPPSGQYWPYTATGLGGTVVRYAAGYAAGEVPKAILGALYQIISIYYDKPVGNDLSSQWNAVETILSPLKLRGV